MSTSFEAIDEIIFLSADNIIAIHEYALIEGGLAGTLNINALHGALHRPQNLHDYEGSVNLVELAAVLWHGISSAHAFCDANKRTALLASLAFLEANGLELKQSVPTSEPGRKIDAWYKADDFTLGNLVTYLQARVEWITEPT